MIKRIAFVDALRGYAIIGVIVVHMSQEFELPNFLNKITASGQMGVSLFFLVSAFTLATSISNRQSGGGGKRIPLLILSYDVFFELLPYIMSQLFFIFCPMVYSTNESWKLSTYRT